MRGRARVTRAFFDPLPPEEAGQQRDIRVLLDTHAFLWWLDGDRRLSLKARRLIANDINTGLVSATSAWEITTKPRLGKLPGVGSRRGPGM
jgi:hypothetical protein